MRKGSIIAGIIIGVVVSGVVGYAAGNQEFAKLIGLSNIFESTKNMSLHSEPIATYTPCRFGNHLRGDDDLAIVCAKNQDFYDDPILGHCPNEVVSFKLFAPEKLKDTLFSVQMDPRCNYDEDIALYQYSNTEFEIGWRDQVSEKRYQTSLWELP